MRRYETIFIIDPDLSEEERSPIFERITNITPQHGGLLVMFDEWGMKRLAYEIKKKARGYYVRLDYCGTGKLVNEIERFFRIDDRVLKYMTVLVEKDVDLENIKEEIALAEAKAKEADQSIESGEVQDASEVPETDTETNEIIQTESDKEEL
jgi:small subunit ribosomal protein S6